MNSWLLPPGFNLLIILLGLLTGIFWRKVGQFFVVIGFASLWLLSSPIIAYHLIDLLQNQYSLLPSASLLKANSNDAIVVLGAGDAIQAEYNYKHTVSDFTLRRLKYAAYLHQYTHLPVIVSGGHIAGSSKSEADLMADILQDNFNLHRIFKEDKSLTTAEESQFILPLLQQHHLNKVYLVTDAWHMPRSVFIFQCAGIPVVPAPMGQFVYGPGYALISYLPNMDALHASSLAIHEFIGLAWYHARYGNRCV